MTDAAKTAVHVSGLAVRGGGASRHAKILNNELERPSWYVDVIALELVFAGGPLRAASDCLVEIAQ
jgi:hypothetical protein